MKVLRVIFAVVLFVAAVFVSTANMHDVAIMLPRVPVEGWPLAGELHAPLFMVILTSLVVGVVITGLATLFEQIRLRTVARRARKERSCRRSRTSRPVSAGCASVAARQSWCPCTRSFSSIACRTRT